MERPMNWHFDKFSQEQLAQATISLKLQMYMKAIPSFYFVIFCLFRPCNSCSDRIVLLSLWIKPMVVAPMNRAYEAFALTASLFSHSASVDYFWTILLLWHFKVLAPKVVFLPSSSTIWITMERLSVVFLLLSQELPICVTLEWMSYIIVITFYHIFPNITKWTFYSISTQSCFPIIIIGNTYLRHIGTNEPGFLLLFFLAFFPILLNGHFIVLVSKVVFLSSSS